MFFKTAQTGKKKFNRKQAHIALLAPLSAKRGNTIVNAWQLQHFPVSQNDQYEINTMTNNRSTLMNVHLSN